MMWVSFWRTAGVMLLVAVQTLPLAAQQMRDPTIAPPEASTPAGAVAQSPLGLDGMAVVVRDGKPYLVAGTRLYAPGERFGNLRVERITETEVWLHDGNGPVRVQRFAGIERKVVIDKPTCGPIAPTTGVQPADVRNAAKVKKQQKSSTHRRQVSTPKPLPPVAPCEDTHSENHAHDQ